jgi:hypothetical protein
MPWRAASGPGLAGAIGQKACSVLTAEFSPKFCCARKCSSCIPPAQARLKSVTPWPAAFQWGLLPVFHAPPVLSQQAPAPSARCSSTLGAGFLGCAGVVLSVFVSVFSPKARARRFLACSDRGFLLRQPQTLPRFSERFGEIFRLGARCLFFANPSRDARFLLGQPQRLPQLERRRLIRGNSPTPMRRVFLGDRKSRRG